MAPPRLAVLALAALLPLAACSDEPVRNLTPGQPITQTLDPAAAAQVIRAYAPASIRLHALSRWDAQSPEPVLIVHIELLDSFDDPVKWPAVITLRVSPDSGFLGSVGSMFASDPVLFTSNQIDAPTSRDHFDPITRGTVLKLSGLPSWASKRPPVRIELGATCPLPDGGTVDMEAQGAINAAAAPVAATPAAATPTPSPTPSPATAPAPTPVALPAPAPATNPAPAATPAIPAPTHPTAPKPAAHSGT